MKRIIIIGVILALIISAVIISFLYSENTIYPKSMAVEEINVSNSKITLKCTFAASGQRYVGYSTEYRNEVLYIKLKGALMSLSKPRQPEFSIDNTFGNIKKVYLQGNNSSDDVLIYSKR